MTDEEAIEIPLKRSVLIWRIVFLAPIGLLLLYGGLVLLLRSGGETGAPFGPNVGTWLFFALVMIAGAVDTARVASIRRAAVRIDATGLLDRRVLRAPLPWSAITRAELQTLQGKPAILGFWTEQPARYVKPAPLWNYFGLVYVLKTLAWRFRFAPISIDLQPLRADPEALVAEVARRWGEPERREVGPVGGWRGD